MMGLGMELDNAAGWAKKKTRMMGLPDCEKFNNIQYLAVQYNTRVCQLSGQMDGRRVGPTLTDIDTVAR